MKVNEIAGTNNPPATRRRVAARVTLITVSMVLLVPSADKFLAARSRRAIFAERLARHDETELHRLDDRLAELRKVADQWRRRAIRPGAAETCENDIIAIARKLDCQVRRASLGASGQRPWRRGANPYEELEWQDDVSDEEDEGIVLSTTSLSMTVVGSFEQLQRFLAEVESMDRLIGFDTVELLPGDTSHVELMQIELKLLLFDLDRGVDLAIARDRPDA